MAIPNRRLKPKTIAARERAMQALNLRKAGVSFGQIAEQLNYADESGARKAVQALLANTEYEQVDEARRLAVLRLDAILQGGQKSSLFMRAINGELYAIDRVLKLEERRARLLGLDAPTTIHIGVDMRQVAELAALATEKGVKPSELFEAMMQELANADNSANRAE